MKAARRSTDKGVLEDARLKGGMNLGSVSMTSASESRRGVNFFVERESGWVGDRETWCDSSCAGRRVRLVYWPRWRMTYAHRKQEERVRERERVNEREREKERETEREEIKGIFSFSVSKGNTLISHLLKTFFCPSPPTQSFRGCPPLPGVFPRPSGE